MQKLKLELQETRIIDQYILDIYEKCAAKAFNKLSPSFEYAYNLERKIEETIFSYGINGTFLMKSCMHDNIDRVLVFDIELCSFGKKSPMENSSFIREVLEVMSTLLLSGHILHWSCNKLYGPMGMYDKLIEKYGGLSAPYTDIHGNEMMVYTMRKELLTKQFKEDNLDARTNKCIQ